MASGTVERVGPAQSGHRQRQDDARPQPGSGKREPAGLDRPGDAGLAGQVNTGRSSPHDAWIRAAGALTARDVIERVAELLEVSYRSADLGNVDDVLSETIYILLSLNTRERVYQQIYADLRSTYPTWLDVLAAPAHELEDLLRPGGLQVQRARYLKDLLEAVHHDNEVHGIGPSARQDLTLEYLHDLNDLDAETFLDALPGVGKKSARCVMAYSLGRESFAVDTHVERILTRLGLTPERNSKVDHEAFQEIVPSKLRKQLHINLVHHGRAICRSTPRCHECVLVSFCGRGCQNIRERNDKSPVAVDLFAGAGGLGSGFRKAGYRIAVAVEKDRHAAQTYRANNRGVPVLEADVTKLSAATIREFTSGEPDVILAGPPCQGYSAAGARIPEDRKNLLFRRVVTMAEQLRAQQIVLENVPGLNKVNGVSFTNPILKALRRTYAAELHQITASSFGVPQNRKRYFFIGCRKDLGSAPTCPVATHSSTAAGPGTVLPETPRLEHVLAGPLELEAGMDAEYLLLKDGTRLLNASTMRHSARVAAKIASIEPGKGPISYRRLERDVARTLVAGHRALPVHPWLDRTISVREAARIQGFPDSYVFCGPRAEQPLQVANAVPPPVATAVAVHILKST